MKKRLLVRIGVAIVLVAIGIFWPRWFGDEPSHKGKPIHDWVEMAVEHNIKEDRAEIKKMGPLAVPYLIEKLKTRDTWFRKAQTTLRGYVPRFLRLRMLERDALTVRFQAAEMLAAVGPAAEPAVPQLIRLVQEKPRNGDGSAVSALGVIGPAAHRALPALHQALLTQDMFNQVSTAWAIWEIGRETNLVLEIFSKAIGTNNTGADVNAALALSRMGPAALSLAPTLIQVFQDSSRPLGARGNAARALGKIGFKTKDSFSALMAGTRDAERKIRVNCAAALWHLDNRHASLAVPIMVEGIAAWNERNPDHAVGFVRSLEYDGLDMHAAIPSLKDLLKSESPTVRKIAAEALEAWENRSAQTR